MDSQDSDKNLEIFKNIGEIITTQEFNTANADFFSLNASKFDDNADENKHEYMQLFEQYVSMADKILEAKLKQDHGVSDEQMQAFFATFEDNKQRYVQENTDTVDLLFTMINFDALRKR